MESKNKVAIVIALIGLAVVLGVAVNGYWDKLFDAEELLPVLEENPDPVPPSKWVVIASENFDQPGDWYEGDRSQRWPKRWDVARMMGRYRWQVEIEGTRIQRLQEAPYGPAQDLRVAVDVAIPLLDHGRGAAGLLFGRTGQEDYSFWLDAAGYYEVLRGSGDNLETLVRWTSAPSATDGPNRLAVEVRSRVATFRINGKVVGQMTLAEYVGGKVGLVAGGDDRAAFVAEFDNFLLERQGN